jgi:hypothetical protein
MEVSAKSIQHLVEFNLLYRNMYVFFRENAPGSEWRMGNTEQWGNFESDIATAGKLPRHDQQSPLPQYSITPPLPPELPSQHNNFPKVS